MDAEYAPVMFYLLRENKNNETENENMMKMKIIEEINSHNVGMNANQPTSYPVFEMWFVVAVLCSS